jgi:hypothetical protein
MSLSGSLAVFYVEQVTLNRHDVIIAYELFLFTSVADNNSNNSSIASFVRF